MLPGRGQLGGCGRLVAHHRGLYSLGSGPYTLINSGPLETTGARAAWQPRAPGSAPSPPTRVRAARPHPAPAPQSQTQSCLHARMHSLRVRLKWGSLPHVFQPMAGRPIFKAQDKPGEQLLFEAAHEAKPASGLLVGVSCGRTGCGRLGGRIMQLRQVWVCQRLRGAHVQPHPPLPCFVCHAQRGNLQKGPFPGPGL